MKGVFEHKDHKDLLGKLEREYERLKSAPLDSDIASNFVATAWHMLEWVYPEMDQWKARNTVRDANPVLLICEHLAVSGKHFEVSNSRIDSVKSSGKVDAWGGSWGNSWGDSWTTMQICLSGEAAEKYGSVIKLQDLAREVMEFWRSFELPK